MTAGALMFRRVLAAFNCSFGGRFGFCGILQQLLVVYFSDAALASDASTGAIKSNLEKSILMRHASPNDWVLRAGERQRGSSGE